MRGTYEVNGTTTNEAVPPVVVPAAENVNGLIVRSMRAARTEGEVGQITIDCHVYYIDAVSGTRVVVAAAAPLDTGCPYPVPPGRDLYVDAVHRDCDYHFTYDKVGE